MTDISPEKKQKALTLLDTLSPPPKPNPKTHSSIPVASIPDSNKLPQRFNALSLPNRVRSKLRGILENKLNGELLGEFTLCKENIKAFIPDPVEAPQYKHGKSNRLTTLPDKHILVNS